MSRLAELLDKYLDQEDLNRTEGRKGVENLARIVRTLGYEDFQFYGQLPNGACMGDIFDFLEDNPGCMEAILDWIGNARVKEWETALENELEPCEFCGKADCDNDCDESQAAEALEGE